MCRIGNICMPGVTVSWIFALVLPGVTWGIQCRFFIDLCRNKKVPNELSGDRRLGGESAPAPPPHREIVSFRSCVRARGVSYVSSDEKCPGAPGIFYLLARASVSFISGDWCLSGFRRVFSKRVLKESTQREFSKRVLKESSRREFSKSALEESSQGECSKRVFKESLQSEFSKRVLKGRSQRELSKRVRKESFQREFPK